jgi:hypothetical protein
MNIGPYRPILELPVLAPAVVREEGAAPAANQDSHGIEPARAHCGKLRGPAREMCYKALGATTNKN